MPLKKLIREIVNVGFEAGLLREGDRQENLGKNMGGREEVAKECWDLVCPYFPHKTVLCDVQQVPSILYYLCAYVR